MTHPKWCIVQQNIIKCRVTSDEKKLIEQEAKKRGLNISSYIKSVSIPDEKEDDNFSIAKPLSGNNKEKRVEIRLTSDEYELIKNEACEKGISMSKYIRKKTLSEKTSIYIDVYDDDIAELSKTVNPKLDRILGILKALSMQSQLHENQYNKMKSILNELSENVDYLLKQYRKNCSNTCG